jgi:hypothetical protein
MVEKSSAIKGTTSTEMDDGKVGADVYVVNDIEVAFTGEENLATSAKQDTTNTYLGKLIDGTTGIKSGENHIGEVGGNSDVITASPANTNEAYSGSTTAPVCVGTKLTFTDAMRTSGGKGIVQTLKLIDTNNIKAALVLMLFNQDMTNGTYTNKSAPSFGTDIANFAGMITINTSDYQTAGGVAVADISATSKLIKAVGSANLYGILLATGTPTYTGNNALTLKLGMMRD